MILKSGLQDPRVVPLLLKRFVNYLLVRTQYSLGTQKVKGYPYSLIIDTVNACNLHCPLCPTGLGMPGRAKGVMSMETFVRIIDQLSPYAFSVVLHNWGEPLLNKEIHSMIAYANTKRLRTVLSSNLCLLDTKTAENLVSCGLDEIIVSLDGVTEETYLKYRRGGSFATVLGNIELLVNKKKESNSGKPSVVWQFLVFKHNEHEVSRVKPMAQELGVNRVEILSGSLGGPNQSPYIDHPKTKEFAVQWLVPAKQYPTPFDYFSNSGYLNKNRCYFLWKSASFNWDGSVSPCCCVYDTSTDFGNICQDDFATIWNNDLFQSARAACTGRAVPKETIRTICSQCKVFRKA